MLAKEHITALNLHVELLFSNLSPKRQGTVPLRTYCVGKSAGMDRISPSSEVPQRPSSPALISCIWVVEVANSGLAVWVYNHSHPGVCGVYSGNKNVMVVWEHTM